MTLSLAEAEPKRKLMQLSSAVISREFYECTSQHCGDDSNLAVKVLIIVNTAYCLHIVSKVHVKKLACVRTVRRDAKTRQVTDDITSTSLF